VELFEGSTHFEVLPAGKRLTVTPDGEAVVRRDHDFVKQDETVCTAETSFGPYMQPMLMAVSCTSGQLTFSVADATHPVLSAAEALAASLAALPNYDVTGTFALQVVDGVLTWTTVV